MLTFTENQSLTFLRHTHNLGDALTEDGVAAALDLGRTLTPTQFSIIVVSGTQRTAQTAACLLVPGVVTVFGGVVVNEGFGSGDWPGWTDLVDRANSRDVRVLADFDEDRAFDTRRAVREATESTLERVGASGSALVVSHSPIIEFAIWELTGTAPDPFDRGQYFTLSSANTVAEGVT